MILEHLLYVFIKDVHFFMHVYQVVALLKEDETDQIEQMEYFS